MTLRGAGRSFAFNLGPNIIAQGMRQKITKAVEDAEALGYIRDVCFHLSHRVCFILKEKIIDFVTLPRSLPNMLVCSYFDR